MISHLNWCFKFASKHPTNKTNMQAYFISTETECLILLNFCFQWQLEFDDSVVKEINSGILFHQETKS